METENEDLVSFYAVIIDATFPYKVDDNKYLCHLKVIDPTKFTADGKDDEEFATILIQGRRF